MVQQNAAVRAPASPKVLELVGAGLALSVSIALAAAAVIVTFGVLLE
jgi:hypothetical protein